MARALPRVCSARAMREKQCREAPVLRTLARAPRAARFVSAMAAPRRAQKAADAAPVPSAGTFRRQRGASVTARYLLRAVCATAGPGTPAPRNMRPLSPVDTPRHNPCRENRAALLASLSCRPGGAACQLRLACCAQEALLARSRSAPRGHTRRWPRRIARRGRRSNPCLIAQNVEGRMQGR